MAELQAALERGWDLDDVLSAAIRIVGDADGTYISTFAWFGVDEFVAKRALQALEQGSFIVREARKRWLRKPETVTWLTKSGEAARDRLTELRQLEPTARRQMCRTIMLNGLYHDGTVEVDFDWDNVWGVVRRPWCSYGGERLHSRRDVESTLTEFDTAGLVQFEERPTGAGIQRKSRIYSLTHDGVRCIEEFGGSLNDWKKARQAEQPATVDDAGSQPGPAVTMSTVINGSVTNLHSGTGNLIIGYDPAAIGLLVEQLRASSNSLVFHDESERKALSACLDALGSEPDPAHALTLASRIRGIFAKAQGPLATVAVGLIDAELRKLGGLPPAA